MSPQLNRASAIAVAATFLVAIASAQGSGAFAQDSMPVAINSEPKVEALPEPADQPLPEATVLPQTSEPGQPEQGAASLAALVSAQPAPESLSPELRCLAGAIYFEAKSESLAGQLAVGRVVIARAKSGRFPASYCGVVYQPSQFSFVRGHTMPSIPVASQDWREAVAIAHIADTGAWRSPVEGALFFHAARVSPRWRLTRIARVDNHVFYR